MTQETPLRRASDSLERLSDSQKKAKIRKLVMQSMCMLIMVLQGLDAASTFIALNTGHLVEKNELLTKTAQQLDVPIEAVVLGAKVFVTSLFGFLMIKQKPTINAVVVLFFLAAFYIVIVHRNFYWVSIFSAINVM
jgi:hypothetical protein